MHLQVTLILRCPLSLLAGSAKEVLNMHKGWRQSGTNLLGKGEGGFKALLLTDGDGLHQSCEAHLHMQPGNKRLLPHTLSCLR